MVRPVHRRLTAAAAALLLSVRLRGDAEPADLTAYHPLTAEVVNEDLAQLQ